MLCDLQEDVSTGKKLAYNSKSRRLFGCGL